MALPSVVLVRGRKIYKDAKGRFTSKATYEREIKRDPLTGRFGRRPVRTPETEARLRQQMLGRRPPPGMTWIEIASKYASRFRSQWRAVGV